MALALDSCAGAFFLEKIVSDREFLLMIPGVLAALVVGYVLLVIFLSIPI